MASTLYGLELIIERIMRLNDLNSKAWIKLSKNTWITQKLLAWSGKVKLSKQSTFVIKQKKYKAKSMSYRPIDETRVKLIELFTQKGACVFDPDIQQGDTLAAALHADCEFIGIAKTEYQKLKAVYNLDYHLRKKMYCLLDEENDQGAFKRIKNESVDFFLTEIPLFDFKHSRMSYQDHLAQIKRSLMDYVDKIAPKAYATLIVADQRYQGRYYCRHADIINVMKDTPFISQGLINVIQDSQALRAYGYPSTYVPNIINQFALIFRK